MVTKTRKDLVSGADQDYTDRAAHGYIKNKDNEPQSWYIPFDKTAADVNDTTVPVRVPSQSRGCYGQKHSARLRLRWPQGRIGSVLWK